MTDLQPPAASALSALQQISSDLAALVESASRFVVRVEDGSRLTGTGVIWSSGLIVTSSHGLERDEDLSIELSDGTSFPATLLGRDPDSDLAVLKVDATDLAPAPKADASTVRVGSLVLALGRPGDFGLQATIGLISTRFEVETHGSPEYVLNTDAVLYPGFSGGPLLGADGNVVGIVNRWFGRGSAVALGVPIVDTVVGSVREHGKVPRGYLGVRTQLVPLPKSLSTVLERDQEHGLLVVQVEAESPADQAGLLLGDILVGIDAAPLGDVESLRKHLRVGSNITVQTIRGGTKSDVEVIVKAQN